VAFLVVRADLTSQVQYELRQQAAVVERLARHYHGHIPAGWVPQDSGRFGATNAYAQVVTVGGAVRAPAGDSGLLPASAAAAQVAAGQRGSYYTQTTLNGCPSSARWPKATAERFGRRSRPTEGRWSGCR
jgi:hypothetical protein